MDYLDKEISLLFGIIEDRRKNPIENSYTSYLFDKGLDKILKKVGEESSEVIIASKNENSKEVVNETCDLLYHLVVLLVEKGISIEDINEEMEKRRLKICNLKAERKPIEIL